MAVEVTALFRRPIPNGCCFGHNPLLLACSASNRRPTGTLELQQAAAFQITVGQAYTVGPGADRFTSCHICCTFYAVATGLAAEADCRHLVAPSFANTSWFAVEAPARPTDTAANVEGSRQTPSYVSLSDKYAIVDAAGTQMLLEEGRWYTCNRLQVGVRLERTTISLTLCSTLCAQLSCHCRLNQAAQSSLAEFLHPKKTAHFQVADHTWKTLLLRQRSWKSSRGRR